MTKLEVLTRAGLWVDTPFGSFEKLEEYHKSISPAFERMQANNFGDNIRFYKMNEGDRQTITVYRFT